MTIITIVKVGGVKLEIDKNKIFHDYPDIVNIKDLQKMLGIGRNKAYELLKTNQIQSIKIGRDYKIPKVYVIEYLIKKFDIQNNIQF